MRLNYDVTQPHLMKMSIVTLKENFKQYLNKKKVKNENMELFRKAFVERVCAAEQSSSEKVEKKCIVKWRHKHLCPGKQFFVFLL